jgi:hypothetical protein
MSGEILQKAFDKTIAMSSALEASKNKDLEIGKIKQKPGSAFPRKFLCLAFARFMAKSFLESGVSTLRGATKVAAKISRKQLDTSQ